MTDQSPNIHLDSNLQELSELVDDTLRELLRLQRQCGVMHARIRGARQARLQLRDHRLQQFMLEHGYIPAQVDDVLQILRDNDPEPGLRSMKAA